MEKYNAIVLKATANGILKVSTPWAEGSPEVIEHIQEGSPDYAAIPGALVAGLCTVQDFLSQSSPPRAEPKRGPGRPKKVEL